jgi:hypothetical protein
MCLCLSCNIVAYVLRGFNSDVNLTRKVSHCWGFCFGFLFSQFLNSKTMFKIIFLLPQQCEGNSHGWDGRHMGQKIRTNYWISLVF